MKQEKSGFRKEEFIGQQGAEIGPIFWPNTPRADRREPLEGFKRVTVGQAVSVKV